MIVYTIAFLKNGVIDHFLGSEKLSTKKKPKLMTLKLAAYFVKRHTRTTRPPLTPVFTAVLVPVWVSLSEHVKPPKGGAAVVVAAAGGNRRRSRATAAAAAADMN